MMFRFLGFLAIALSLLVAFNAVVFDGLDKLAVQVIILLFGLLMFNKADIVDLENKVYNLEKPNEKRQRR